MDEWMDGVWRGHTFFHWVLVPLANLPIAAEGSTKSVPRDSTIGVHPTELVSIWAT